MWTSLLLKAKLKIKSHWASVPNQPSSVCSFHSDTCISCLIPQSSVRIYFNSRKYNSWSGHFWLCNFNGHGPMTADWHTLYLAGFLRALGHIERLCSLLIRDSPCPLCTAAQYAYIWLAECILLLCLLYIPTFLDYTLHMLASNLHCRMHITCIHVCNNQMRPSGLVLSIDLQCWKCNTPWSKHLYKLLGTV